MDEDGICHTLRGEGFDASEDGAGRGTPIVCFDTAQITSPGNYSVPKPGDPAPPLNTAAQHHVAFTQNQREEVRDLGGVAGAVSAAGGTHQDTYVRRLTPRECERLQGFPDDHTAVQYRNKPACDGPRYKALGNSMAVPCVEWVLENLQKIGKEKA